MGATTLKVPRLLGTFQETSGQLLNILPPEIRETHDFNAYCIYQSTLTFIDSLRSRRSCEKAENSTSSNFPTSHKTTYEFSPLYLLGVTKRFYRHEL